MPLGSLGNIDTVSRARLKYGGDADIKALMSKADVLADLPSVQIVAGAEWSEVKALRDTQTSARTPLLLLYPIYKKSKAQARSQKDREDMDAVHDIMGFAIVFPTPADKAVVLGYKRARIDSYLDDEPEYTEETLRDDDVAA
jgi:hypothetical protein